MIVAPRATPPVTDARAALVEGFLDHLGRQRRLSGATHRGYAHDLQRLLELSASLALDRIEPHHVRRMVAQLHASGLGGASIARTLSAWRGFFRWLARFHGYTINPCAGVRAPKTEKALPGALSPDEAQRLLDAAPTGPLEVRDRAMFELFYSSGLRLAELVGLDLGHARTVLDEGEVTVLGKGGKRRTVPVGRLAQAGLAAWLAVRATIASPQDGALFVGARGARVAPSVVRDRLKRWAVRCGLPMSVHPHMLRHSFASHVLQSSGDLRAVQEMLGHASISTTQIYTHLDFQHLARVYDQAHPRAHKKPSR